MHILAASSPYFQTQTLLSTSTQRIDLQLVASKIKS